MDATTLDAEEALRAALACEAVNAPTAGRELDLRPLEAAEIYEVTRVPMNDTVARERLGPIFGSLLAWLVGVMPFARAYTMDGTHGRMLIFKGTAPPHIPERKQPLATEWESRAGWMLNISLGLSRQVQDSLKQAGYDFPGIVHGGFAMLLSSYSWDAIIDFARNSGSQGLIVAGHSQGGAVAALAAYRLASQGLPVRVVYTFGSPRPANDVFRDSYSINHWRFEHPFDPIPIFCPLPYDVGQRIPKFVRTMLYGGTPLPDPVDFRHVGRLLVIDAGGLNLGLDGSSALRLVAFGVACAMAAGREKIASAHRPAERSQP